MQLSREEIRALIDQALHQLAAHEPFRIYMELVKSDREAVIADLCSDAVVGDTHKTAAAIGELRTYQQIIDRYHEVRDKLPRDGAAPD